MAVLAVYVGQHAKTCSPHAVPTLISDICVYRAKLRGGCGSRQKQRNTVRSFFYGRSAKLCACSLASRFVRGLSKMMFGEHPRDSGLREDDGAERLAPPASPSNSWSSAETAPAPTQELLVSAGDEPSAPARPKRCKISREQLDVLVKSFEEEPLPNFDQRQAMAKHLGMTPRSVQIWFQNRRQRLKPTPKAAPESLAQPSASHQHHAQHYGMPGLAAAAGLFGAGYGGAAQLPMHPQSGMQSFIPCDVMEPFAATKALLGAGYQPQSSMLNLGMRSYQHAGGSEVLPPQQAAPCSSIPDVMQTPSTQATCAAAADAYAMAPAAAPMAACCSGATPYAVAASAPAADANANAHSAAPAADGLLLLLACGGGLAPERSAIASA